MLPPDERLVRVMKFIERWRPPASPQDNQADLEMQMVTRIAEAIETGRFSRYQKPYVDLALAMILRRHGENRQAGPIIDRLTDYKEFSPGLRDAVRRMRDSIPLEHKHQAEAADRLERALLAGQIKATNQGTARYLLGELNRRLGRDRQAVAWFDKALAWPELPAELKTWASQQRALCLAGSQR